MVNTLSENTNFPDDILTGFGDGPDIRFGFNSATTQGEWTGSTGALLMHLLESTDNKGNLTITGSITADSGLATSDFPIGIHVNTCGADSDTRFEGDTDAALLFLDAGNNRVGIGTSTPATLLDVDGAATFETVASSSATIPV